MVYFLMPCAGSPKKFTAFRPGACGAGERGFTLTELLLVICIMVLLASAITTGFNSISQARGVTEAAEQISGAVDLARNEAVTRQTYVWLALQPTNTNGNSSLIVGVFYSKDGSSATNTNGSNLASVVKPLVIEKVALTNASALNLGGYLTAGSTDLYSSTAAGFSFQSGKANNFTNCMSLTFMPLGEVTTQLSPGASDGFIPYIMIGLQGMRGMSAMSNNDIAIGIDGSVGVPSIIRK
jgi:prepilin-type N-terminal cleavage/methylation domain-containing protein